MRRMPTIIAALIAIALGVTIFAWYGARGRRGAPPGEPTDAVREDPIAHGPVLQGARVSRPGAQAASEDPDLGSPFVVLCRMSSGQPVARARVTLSRAPPMDRSDAPHIAETDADGRAEFAMESPVLAVVDVTASGFAPVRRARVLTSGSIEVALRRSQMLTVRATDASTGRPLDAFSATVLLLDVRGQMLSASVPASGVDGIVEVEWPEVDTREGVTPTLRVEASGFQTTDVRRGPAPVTSFLDVSVRRRVFRIRVSDAETWTGVGGVSLTGVGVFGAETDPDGFAVVAIRGPGAGGWGISLWHPEYVPARYVLQATEPEKSDPEEVRLTRGACLRLRIQRTDSQPIETTGFVLFGSLATGGAKGKVPLLPASGAAVLHVVRGASYRAVVDVPGCVRERVCFRVTEECEDATVTLRPSYRWSLRVQPASGSTLSGFHVVIVPKVSLVGIGRGADCQETPLSEPNWLEGEVPPLIASSEGGSVVCDGVRERVAELGFFSREGERVPVVEVGDEWTDDGVRRETTFSTAR